MVNLFGNLKKLFKKKRFEWKSPNESYYSEDIWKKAYRIHKDKIEKGITIYAEIVGEGIQGKDYTYNFEHEVFVYRITQTNIDGNVYELSWEALKKYCDKYGLKYVDEYFVGKVSEIISENETNDDMLDKLKSKYLDKSYPDCKVDEGICIRVRKTDEIFKLKSPKFIAKESEQLDSGVENIEDNQ